MLEDNQAGFGKERGSTDNIYILNYAIQEEIYKEKGKLYPLFADLTAAIDKVNRLKLIDKLKRSQVPSNLIARMAGIYEETSNTITMHNETAKNYGLHKD